MVTDSINSVAHSVFSNKGVFALLLGSGVSRAAEIPTGWEITLELIRQIAVLEGKKAGDKPDEWFIKNKGQKPDYAALLESLPGTADERQAIIKSYIEPSEEDRQEGRKVPTKAHHAIAELIEKGYIRVILTTNFDRLLEAALTQKGIEPIVISSEDDVIGAPPITHGQCFIIKLHGDYLDSRIKNTPEELDSYSKEMNKYIDSILDQFGLIVCGWSGAWDTSLRKAIKRCPSRRYTTFWAARGDLGQEAKELVKKRDAQTVEIQDADTFFDELKEKVRALEDLRRPAPMDVRIATAMVKRYLAEDKHRIRLKDTVLAQTAVTLEMLASQPLSVDVNLSPEEFSKRLKIYEGHTEILRSVVATGAFYSRPEQNGLWPDVVQRLYKHYPFNSGSTIYLGMQRYPALLAFYTIGVAAVAGENYDLLNRMFQAEMDREYGDEQDATEVLLPYNFRVDVKAWKTIEAYNNKRFPLSEYLCDFLQENLLGVEPDKNRLEVLFDRFELMAALSYGYLQGEKGGRTDWFPSGRYSWRFDRDYDSRDLTAFLNNAKKLKEKWAPIRAGMFGGSYEKFEAVKKAFDPFVEKVARQW